MINYRKLRLYFCQFIFQISGKFPGSAQAIPAEATSTFHFHQEVGSVNLPDFSRKCPSYSAVPIGWILADLTGLIYMEKDLQRFFIKWLETHH